MRSAPGSLSLSFACLFARLPKNLVPVHTSSRRVLAHNLSGHEASEASPAAPYGSRSLGELARRPAAQEVSQDYCCCLKAPSSITTATARTASASAKWTRSRPTTPGALSELDTRASTASRRVLPRRLGKFYRGNIARDRGDGTYDIVYYRYDDGGRVRETRVAKRLIRLVHRWR